VPMAVSTIPPLSADRRSRNCPNRSG
jgi:hypothetical protein